MLLNAIAKAFHNLLLPGVIKLFAWCLLAYALGCTALAWLTGDAIAWLAGGHNSLFLHAIGTLGGGMIAWFLFPLLYPILVSFFDDHMAEVIEREDYPQLPKASPPFWPTFGADALFSLKALGLNIVLIPFYMIPLMGIGLYYVVNGWLLGTQFFRMSAGRRASHAEAEALSRRARGAVLAGGVLISFCSTIPLLNLAAPLLGVATMLHLFHGLNGTAKVEILPPR